MDTIPPIPPLLPLTPTQSIATSAITSPLQALPPLPPPHPPLPAIISPSTLLAAVQTDPTHIFTHLVSVINERDALRHELLSITEDFRNARKDWKCAREKYEELVEIGTAKQVLIWKFVERLKLGGNGGEGDGNEEGVGTGDGKEKEGSNVDGNRGEFRGESGLRELVLDGSSEGRNSWSSNGGVKGLALGCGGLDPNAVSSPFIPLTSLQFPM
jgi:hypothetical protein